MDSKAFFIFRKKPPFHLGVRSVIPRYSQAEAGKGKPEPIAKKKVEIQAPNAFRF